MNETIPRSKGRNSNGRTGGLKVLPLMLMPNPLAPGFAGVAWWECERNPLHTAGRAYGPADPRQGQADFVSTKNQCEYAALTRISRPTDVPPSVRKGKNVMRKFKGKKAAAERVRTHRTATRKTGAVLLRKSRLTTFGLHGWLVMLHPDRRDRQLQKTRDVLEAV